MRASVFDQPVSIQMTNRAPNADIKMGNVSFSIVRLRRYYGATIRLVKDEPEGALTEIKGTVFYRVIFLRR